MMGFAWQCIDFFFIKGYSKSKVLRLLKYGGFDNMSDSRDIINNPFYMIYYYTFNNTENEKYLNQFYKYCYLYLDKFYKGIN